MRIAAVENLHCDAGWRTLSFLKITTNKGLVGYSEYSESYGSLGLSGVIQQMENYLIGKDPRQVQRIISNLVMRTRQAPGGLLRQAIAAVENALLDIKGKSLSASVADLFGGSLRDKMRIYWSHFGTYRLHHAAKMGKTAVRSLEDLQSLAEVAVNQGFTALKTNILRFSDDPDENPVVFMPGFGRQEDPPDLNWSRRLIGPLRQQIAVIRQGAGDTADLLLDLNFNFKTEGYLQITRALDECGLSWFEIDSFDPAALRDIRTRTATPIASGESLYGRREYLPYFERHAMDVAIVDVPWNGFMESFRIAAMANTYEINVAPHNFYGPLATLMSAQFCACIENFRLMEIEVDDVPWMQTLVTNPATIENGFLRLPTGPGWGSDLNEDVIRAHPAPLAPPKR